MEGLRAPTAFGKRPAPLVGFLVSAAVVSIGVGIGTHWLPPAALGVALMAYLGLTGLLFFRRQLAISRSFQRWRHVMPCYLSVQDRQLRIIESNDLFHRDFGDPAGRTCYSAYKQRSSPCPDCPVLQTFADGRNHTSEETVITKDGTVAHVVVSSTPLFDRRGRTAAVVEMSTNVTEIQDLRRELDQSRQYFSRLFDIVPCYISVQDREYRIVESNALFRNEFGECTGKRCFQAYKGRKTVCPGCPVERTFADGQVHTSEEFVTTRHGQHASTVVYTAPLYDNQGAIVSVMEVSTNITEVKQQHKLAMIGLAIAGMAHRIKNILMGLEGGMFVVNTGFETADTTTVDEGWRMVDRNVKRISQMVKDLLYCSKERQPELETGVMPCEILHEVHDLYRSQTAREQIELQLELGPQRPGTFDPEALRNLVVNLVTNAVDACRFDPARSEKRHFIVLRCAGDEGGNTRIEVEDNGAGIPDDAREKVFNGFFSTKGTEGTGLGLLVVQKVAQEHGGSVTFTTRAGEGTTFRVLLPPRDGLQPVTDETIGPDLRGRSEGETDEQEGSHHR